MTTKNTPAHSRHRARPDRFGALSATTTMIALVWLSAEIAFSLILIWSHLGGRDFIGVDGGSMEHTIHLGDAIIVHKVSPGQASTLQAGTVVTFEEAGGQRVTHRIVSVLQPGQPGPTGMGTAPAGGVSYITKGDANPTPDAVYRPASSAYGVVEHRVPFGGYVIAFLGSWVDRLICLAPLAWLAPIWLTSRTPGHRREPRPARRVGRVSARSNTHRRHHRAHEVTA